MDTTFFFLFAAVTSVAHFNGRYFKLIHYLAHLYKKKTGPTETPCLLAFVIELFCCFVERMNVEMKVWAYSLRISSYREKKNRSIKPGQLS